MSKERKRKGSLKEADKKSGCKKINARTTNQSMTCGKNSTKKVAPHKCDKNGI